MNTKTENAGDGPAERGVRPVAWKFMQATYGEGDVRGRGWLPALKFTRPMWEVMQKDVQPLFTRAQLDAEVSAERERCSIHAASAAAKAQCGDWAGACESLERLKYGLA